MVRLPFTKPFILVLLHTIYKKLCFLYFGHGTNIFFNLSFRSGVQRGRGVFTGEPREESYEKHFGLQFTFGRKLTKSETVSK